MAVKLPPKNAISAFTVFSFKESTAVSIEAVTSSGEGWRASPVMLRWSQNEQRWGQPLKGMNIATLECLITHQLQCFARGLLLGLFLRPAAAAADDVRVQANVDLEVLVVIGAGGAYELIL